MQTTYTQTEAAPLIDSQTYASRREKLRKLLWRHNLDAILITRPANRFYLSGFELHDSQPDESAGCLVITTSGRDWLATDSRYEEAAAKIWEPESILVYTSPSSRDIASLLKQSGLLIGAEMAGVSHDFILQLKKWGAPALQAADGLVEKLRMIKEEVEIAAMRKSFQLNHKMLAWLEKELKNGVMNGFTEKEIAWEIEKYFRQGGAQELAFATIAAIGKNAAMPHAIPGNSPLGQPDMLLVDIGCRVDDYCSDQTRTFWHGPTAPDYFMETLELVQKAQQAAMQIMRPGVPCSDVYRASRKIFENAGVAKAFNHGLGHGIGLQTHEGPVLSPRNKQPLEKGMTVTVEPGLYYPSWGGVRWEHTVLVEEDGISIL